MDKKQAAQFLGVSTRAIERYAAKGKIGVSYKKNKTGQSIAVLSDTDLQTLKEQLKESPYPQRPAVVAKGSDTIDTPDTESGRTSTALTTKSLANFAEELGISLAKAIATGQPQYFPVPISDKLTLSLSEASHLSGLSRHFLRKAIHDHKLKAAKRGRGWNVKRPDLDSYIQSL